MLWSLKQNKQFWETCESQTTKSNTRLDNNVKYNVEQKNDERENGQKIFQTNQNISFPVNISKVDLLNFEECLPTESFHMANISKIVE